MFDDEKILDREREKLQVIKIDPSRTIRKIAMIVQDDKIAGLRLVDDRGIYIVNETWMTKEQVASEWITRTLPGG